jgi:indolepyruvate ferredoxin oxidoreductase
VRDLKADRLDIACKLARLPEGIRGYGHVKLANVASVKAQWKDLLDRFHSPGEPAGGGERRIAITLSRP